ncbi:MAG: hypothetical protein QNJ60_11670 [Xenococcaceae cyanobacterium MO_188.B19]|nr:hypothetical protein [Xenococcaceae cyanobacterium MO_188.B19]
MSPSSKKSSNNSQDIRLAATSKIWSLAIGMLAICIPLSGVTKSGPILPIAVIFGASWGTTSVWSASTEESTGNSETSEKIEQLEGRIADLETIITSEEIKWRSSIEPTPKNPILNQSISNFEDREKPQQLNKSRIEPS